MMTWISLGVILFIAFYVACNLGANDVANSMGTSVGSKALTLKQAIIIAGILEFTGAILFGERVSTTLATQVTNTETLAAVPQTFLRGMVAVLLAVGIWLQLATRWGLPVASSHATVGAIAGFGTVAAGIEAVNWSTIGIISGSWLITPVMSAAIAATLYSIIRFGILNHHNPLQQLREWIPWLSSALLGVFGVLVLPRLSQPLAVFFEQRWHFSLPAHDFSILIGGIAIASLSGISWRQLARQKQVSLESKLYNPIEQQLAKFQVISACFVAFAHGSNDVGNTIAPLAAIFYVRSTGTVPVGAFDIPTWILVLGGAGIVTGLAIWGKNVITTVGENILSLAPSSGFCAELATAATVLLASKLGLPVSTSHALVGGVVGVGLVQGLKSVDFGTVRSIGLAWLVTVPAATLLSAGIFLFLQITVG
ncbi:MAG: inorganic phosphate transporter [Microcoleaceae cyanobacterium]